MNTTEKTFIPNETHNNQFSKDTQLPEDLIFDEAIKSENIEKKKAHLEKLNKRKKNTDMENLKN